MAMNVDINQWRPREPTIGLWKDLKAVKKRVMMTNWVFGVFNIAGHQNL